MANSSNFTKSNFDSKSSLLSSLSSSRSLSKQSSSSPLNPNNSFHHQRPENEASPSRSSSTLSEIGSQDDLQIKSSISPAYKLRKTTPYGQLQDVNKSSSKLHRIYSENETSNFSQENGRRMFDDQRHRPHRTKFFERQSEYVPDSPLQFTARSFSNFYQANTAIEAPKYKGLEDEYIPDFDFSNTIQQWTDSYYAGADYDRSYDSSLNDSMPSSMISRPLTPVGKLHSQVSPVTVPRPKREGLSIKTDEEGLTNDEELIIAKLPHNFTDLPFSVRRKLLADLSPNGNVETINKIVKKKFRKRQKSSPAVQFLSSFSDRSYKADDKENIVLDHSLGGIIGYGAWGIIRECTSPEGQTRAMKIVRVKNDAAREFFKRETIIWAQLHHDNILRLINVKESSNAIYCLMDRAYGGTLFDLVSKWGVYPSKSIQAKERPSIIKRYTKDILSGLMYMHSKGIVHGDVKLENCLVTNKTSSGKILLCDFGMSLRFMNPIDSDEVTLPKNNTKIKRRPSIPRSYSGNSLKSPKSLLKIFSERSSANEDSKINTNTDNHQKAIGSVPDSPFSPKPFEYESKQLIDATLPHSHIGSLPYAAPELLESSPPPLGPSADIWAFGVLLYTMIVGKLPFQHSFEPRLRAMIAAGKYDTDSLKIAAQNNQELYDTVVGCLTIDMNKRLNLGEVMTLIEGVNIQEDAQ